MGWLIGALAQVAPAGQQVAWAGALMAGVYLLAFLVIPFLPETRGVELTGPSTPATHAAVRT